MSEDPQPLQRLSLTRAVNPNKARSAVSIQKRKAKRRRVLTGKLSDIDPAKVLERYLMGETCQTISDSLGVTEQGLNYWLLRNHKEAWKTCQVIKAQHRKDRWAERQESAESALDVARAREVVRTAQWDLERLDPGNYGPKQEITHLSAPVLNITFSQDVNAAQLPESIDGASQHIIESE